MDSWQDISTAPKTGKPILGGWDCDDHEERIWWTAEAGWQGSESGFWDRRNWPTKWKSLPAPPGR